MSDEHFLTLIELLYDSVLDETRWPEALRAVTTYCGATGLAYIAADTRAHTVIACDSVDVDPDMSRIYLEHYAGRDVRLPAAMLKPAGTVWTNESLVDRRSFLDSEIYNELLLPADVPNMMGTLLATSATSAAFVALEGSLSHGPFEEDAQVRFARVVPHLLRASAVRDRLLQYRHARSAYSEVLERMPFGVILLDAQGAVIEATSFAEKIFKAGLGLVCRRRRIHAQHAEADRLLQPLLHRSARRGDLSPGGSLSVPRPGAAPLGVCIIPLSAADVAFVPVRPAAMMLVTDPDRSPKPTAETIRAAMHLTSAEALLAAVLFDGCSLREASKRLGVSVNTCKTQLKSIYSKTGSRSHAELAKQIMMAHSTTRG